MKRKDILLILVPTFIFVVFWIIFSINHTINTSTISNVESVQIAPIAASFDKKTLDTLKKREIVTPIYEITGASTTNPDLSPTPTPTTGTPVISTSSATQATNGGVLK